MTIHNHIARNVGEMVQRRIDCLKIGQKMQDLPEELWHESFRYYVKEDPDRRGGPNLRMIRLDPGKPSLTVTGFVFNKFVHPYENRFISVREAARLQGFPDDYEFSGSLTSTQQQVGNAVPVQLGRALFGQILNFASACGYKSGSSMNAFSLFCGAGGLDLGACQASEQRGGRLKVNLAIDCWADACATMERNLGDKTKVIQADISAIENPMEFWLENAGVAESPDLVFGGPPCQAFSQAGKQKALDDERGVLVFQFLRFLKELRPAFFLMENVANIMSVAKGSLYKQILSEMDAIGYNVSSGILSAVDYGAPQLRRRMIFLGCKKSFGCIELPQPSYASTPGLFNLPPYNTVGSAFEGLPVLRSESGG